MKKLTIKQRIKKCFILLLKGVYPLNSEILNSQDFYELMQTYRHTPMVEQHNVVKSFEAVKKFIRENYL